MIKQRISSNSRLTKVMKGRWKEDEQCCQKEIRPVEMMFQYVSTVTGLQFVLEETGAKSFVELPYHAFPHRGDSVHEIPLATFEVRVG